MAQTNGVGDLIDQHHFPHHQPASLNGRPRISVGPENERGNAKDHENEQ